jgi:hypothetical protein
LRRLLKTDNLCTLAQLKTITVTSDGTKEEIRLHTEIIKFLMVVLLAVTGGMVTLYNIDKPTHNQEILVTLGWIFLPLLLFGIFALFLYVYSLLKKI